MEMSKTWLMAKTISRQVFCDRAHGASAAPPAKKREITANDLLNEEKWDKGFRGGDKEDIEKARGTVAQSTKNLFVYEGTQHLSCAEDICAKTEAFIAARKTLTPNAAPPVVIIDYLQIVPPDKKNFYSSDKQRVDASVELFSRLREEHGLPLILISSLNRESYRTNSNRGPRGVTMDSFKESGIIEFSADVILGMQLSAIRSGRYDEYEEMAKTPRRIDITVLKQRYGSSGDCIEFDYHTHSDCFEERSYTLVKDAFLQDHRELRVVKF